MSKKEGFVSDSNDQMRFYALAMDAVSEGVWVLTLPEMSLTCSNWFQDILGYSPDIPNAIEYTLSDWQELILQDDWEQMQNCFSLIQDKAIEEFKLIQRHYHVSGRLLYLENRAKVSLCNETQRLQIIGVVQDITSHYQREQELIKAKFEAEQAALAKTQFLSTMSHEIRTPLNAVIGLSRLLLDENPRPDQLEYMQVLKYSSESLLELINDILDFSKLEAGELSLEQTPFHFGQFLKGLEGIFGLKAKKKGIDFKIRAEQDLPDYLRGDTLRLSQVLMNLINNAIKFTEKGAVHLDILSQDETPGSISLYFRVVDSGIGVPKDKQAQIFEQFSQANSDTTRKFGGSGLGLAIVKRLLEIQDSQIYIDSTPDKGSTFYFSLDFPKLSPDEIAVFDQSNNLEKPIDLAGKHILLVEDNLINQLVASKHLESWGLKVSLADNGVKAIELVTTGSYDLILMDLQMPEMDGIEATEVIRELWKTERKSIPIIALTASSMLDLQTDILDHGLDDYITKPFDPLNLKQKIYKYLKI